jgi:hypothetical protein
MLAPRFSHALVYDAVRERVVLVGGTSGGVAATDTWFFEYRSSLPLENCVDAIDADRDKLVGCADPDCAGRCAKCGDGTCDPLESCRLCPSDCGVCPLVCGDFHCDTGETAMTCPGDCSP